MTWTLICGTDLVATPWRNGQGVSRDLVTVRGPDGAMRWQASIADLDGDTDFSDYTGYDRVFTPIAGDIALAFGDGPFEHCPLLVPRPFPGEARVRCRVGQAGQAFNVVVDRQHHRGSATVLRPAAGSTVPADGHGLLFCWDGELVADGLQAMPGDTLTGDGLAKARTASVVIRVQVDRSDPHAR